MMINKKDELREKLLEEEQMISQTASEHLIDFSIATNYDYDPNWHHRVIAEKLEEIEKGKIKRLMLFLPPRSGKSQLATINFPAWYLGRNPKREIITISYSGDLAVEFGGKTRDVVDSREYKEIFNLSLKKDEKSKSKWMTDNQGSYTSVGVGGAITGKGANILLIDDPIKNREEAESEVYRNKVWDFYQSTAYTRLEPGGAVIVILTRWHLDDLAGRLLKAQNEGGEQWEVVEFPAVALEDEKYRKKGEALWKNRFSLEELEQKKRAIGTLNWSALYQQKPILTEDQEFKQHWFKYRDWDEVAKLETRNFLTVDTAISKKASADYTGICRNYVDRENKWNLKTEHYKINPKELIDLLFRLYEQDRYEKIGIEKTIYLQAIKPFLDDEMRKRDKYLPIVDLEHREIAKETRIRGLIPRYESGSIIHIKNECQVLEEEAMTFPMGMNDDVIDALAYQTQIAESPIGDRDERLRVQETRQENLTNEFYE